MSADKFDQDKVQMELVRPEFVEGVAAVLTFGAQKYDANNWTKGLTYTRIIGALKRHLAAIEKGQDYDEESGLPHIDHVGCCVMFLSCFQKWLRLDLDDRLTAGEMYGIPDDILTSIRDGGSEELPTAERSTPPSIIGSGD